MNNSHLKNYYSCDVIPEFVKTHSYNSKYQVPVLMKVVINSGLNTSLEKASVAKIAQDISLISGQKPVITKARKSISNFRLRKGMSIGVKVTMRGSRMYDFLLRFIDIVLPEIRDFRGLGDRLDGNGNYTIGITDHAIFPEISTKRNYDETLGMNITIVTSAKTDKEGYALLKLIGFPFRTES